MEMENRGSLLKAKDRCQAGGFVVKCHQIEKTNNKAY